jgi:hypothetical protein
MALAAAAGRVSAPAMRPAIRAARILAGAGCALFLLLASSAQAQPWRASVLALPELATTAPSDSVTARPAPAPALVSASRVAPTIAQPPPIIGPIAVGLAAAAAGAVGGAAIGSTTDRENTDWLPAGAFTGFLAGEAVLLPIGVHLGNRRQGRFVPDLAVALLGEVGAIGLAGITNSVAGYFLGVGAQLGATVWTERDAAEHKRLEAQAEADAARRAQERGVSIPAPPPEPDPLVPPPPPTK